MACFNTISNVEQVPIDRSNEYTIYVSNLPEELNEEAIKAIFNQYGDIIRMFYRCDTTWAYITYRTFREAELAIRKLHDKKPLCLNIALAKERSDKKQQIQQLNSLVKEELPHANLEPPVHHNDTKYQLQSTCHCQRKPLQDLSAVASVLKNSNNYVDDNSSFVDSNRLWTRGVVTVTADGKRHVSLGRGYNLYAAPDLNPRIEEYDRKVHVLQNNQLYEYSEDKLKHGVRKCTVCCIKTTKHCEKCYTYYCSRTCQITDWQRHQVECKRIPALVDDDLNGEITNATYNLSTNNKATLRSPNVHAEVSHNTEIYKNVTAVTSNSEYKSDQEDYSSVQRNDNDAFLNKNTDVHCFQRFNIHTKTNDRLDQSNNNNDKQDVKNLIACNDKEIAKKDEKLNVQKDICLSKKLKEICPLDDEEFKFIRNTDVKTTVNELRNILDVFADNLSKNKKDQLEIRGAIQIFSCVQKNVYTATFLPEDFIDPMEKIVTELPVECMNLSKLSVHYEPKVGDLICSETESNIWCRGYVSTLSPKLQIAVIDEGRILPAGKVLPYPEKFADICTFGVTCEVTNVELKVTDVYNFIGIMKQHERNQESLEIKIVVGTGQFAAVVKPWKFVPSIQKIHISLRVPEFAKLKNGSKVCLTSYRNHYFMFARSLDETEVERYNNLMQDVAKHANARLLTEPPKINQVVIARYRDGNVYRAMVTKIYDNDKVRIVYIDYGNEEKRDVKELQQAPEKYDKEQSCTAKIKLKDVPCDAMMNTKVDLFLRNLVGKEVALTCTFADESLESDVYLTMPTGESVNEKIKQLLIPDWKQEDDDKTCYMINDIEVASLGCTGDIVQALVLFQGNTNELNYMLGPYDVELLMHITETMPKSLKEYAETTEYYIPRLQELCVALYNGEWYRALCINPNLTNTQCEVFFIDYGNIEPVEHEYIRLMPKDFIVPAAMANICEVVNLAPVDSTGNYSPNVKQKVMELIQLNTFIKIKIVNCVESGEYKVELPEVRAVLIKEGLV